GRGRMRPPNVRGRQGSRMTTRRCVLPMRTPTGVPPGGARRGKRGVPWPRGARFAKLSRTAKRVREVTTVPRESLPRGLTVSLRVAQCAHICRYCLVTETRKGSELPFWRFERLVHRFHDWKASGATDIDIRTFVGPSLDYDIDTLKGVARLRARRGGKFEI